MLSPFLMIVAFVLIGVIFIFVAIAVHNIKNNDLPQIIDFKPSQFEYKLGSKFFYRIGDSIFYSADSSINAKSPMIWSGKVYDCIEPIISPNLEYIAIIDTSKRLNIVKNNGEIIFQLRNFDCRDCFEEKKSGKYKSESIIWSSNSENLYFLKYLEYKGLISDNTMSLMKYSIGSNQLSNVCTFGKDFFDFYYLNKNETKLFYEAYDKKEDELYVKSINLKNFQLDGTYYRRNDSIKLNSDSVFVAKTSNFDFYSNEKRVFCYYTVCGTNFLMLKDLKDANIYSILLFGKYGSPNFKGAIPNFFLDGSLLIGNRYYLCHVESEQYTGQLIIDTQSKMYMKIEPEIHFYYHQELQGSFIHKFHQLMLDFNTDSDESSLLEEYISTFSSKQFHL